MDMRYLISRKSQMMMKRDIDVHPGTADPEHIAPRDLSMVIKLMVKAAVIFQLIRVIHIGYAHAVPIFITAWKITIRIYHKTDAYREFRKDMILLP